MATELIYRKTSVCAPCVPKACVLCTGWHPPTPSQKDHTLCTCHSDHPNFSLSFTVLSLAVALGGCHPCPYVRWSSVGLSFPLTLSPISLSLFFFLPYSISNCMLLSKWDLGRQILRIILCMMLSRLVWERRSIRYIPCAKVNACQ